MTKDANTPRSVDQLTDDEIDELLGVSVCGIPFPRDSDEARAIELIIREADERRAARKRRREAA